MWKRTPHAHDRDSTARLPIRPGTGIVRQAADARRAVWLAGAGPDAMLRYAALPLLGCLVFQLGGHLCFAQKTAPLLLVGARANLHHLDGNFALQLAIVAVQDLAHTSLTEQTDDAKLPSRSYPSISPRTLI